MHLYIVPCLQQDLEKEIIPAPPLLRAKGVRVFQKELVSVQPSPVEEFQKQQ